jgi:autotransporter-associated beta strand protein
MVHFPKTLLSLLVIVLALLPAMAQLPAFPGAEGYGSIASGGRGGDVYHVTNLNPTGPGSLAEGVSTSPPAGRTILFKVSGHIRLSSTLNVSKSKITIAGQSAPGDGICIWNKPTNFTGSDIIIRNIRFRYGKQTAGGDAINLGAAQRIIIDHCDVMFSTDENMSSFGNAPEHMTFQWSTNAWGLNGHSAGGLWKVKHATVHHTLWANNHTRNPKLIGGDVFDWTNNLTFGWNNGFNMAPDTTGGENINHRLNIRNSSFVHGGSTSSAIYGGALNDDGSPKFQLHMADSTLDGNNNGILDSSRTNYQMVNSTGHSQTPTAWPQTHLGDANNPIIGIPVSISPRLTGYKKILSKTGAVRMEIGSRPLRDEITQLCITRAANLQRGIIADPLHLNLSTGTAFAKLQSNPAPTDTDNDGMPDDWEDAVGYDISTANNNTILTTQQTAASFFPPNSPAGHTQLEEYLHFKAVPHGTVGKNTAASPSFIDVDLRKYTSGFTVLPAFTLSNIYGGTTTQSGPGGAIVRFTPNLETSGRAGFHFTVTDTAGDTWTQQCCLLISTKTQPRPVSWLGDGTTNNWDTATANFTSLLGPTSFTNNDAVSINDTGSPSPTIKVIGSLSPASLTVSNNTKNFTIQGTGSLTSTGRFIKSGTGTLTISNTGPNAFTAATLEGGTLSLTTANALGNTPITLNDATLALSADQPNALIIGGSVAINPSSSRTMNGTWSGAGTINLTNTGSNLLTLGGSMANFTGELSLGTSTGSIRLNGNTGSASTAFDLGTSSVTLHTRNGNTTVNLGSLTGGSHTKISGASSGTGNTTFSVGATNASTVFAGSITNGSLGITAPTALTKTGNGTLTLTGNSTHSGTTNINSGSLALLGSFTTSPINIAANATLTGTGTTAGSITTAANAIISPGNDNGIATGTITAASLNLTSPTLRFDLSNNPTTGNDRILTPGPINLSGNLNFIFNLTNGTLSPGTYELITTTGSVTATGTTLTSNLPTNTRQTLTLETHSGGVRLVVSGNQGNLTWNGSNGALWNQQTTASWSGASPATFFNFDQVTFTDTASNGSVTITQPVAPQSITVNNTATRAFTFTGAPITGSTSLVKSGPGSLTLNVPRYDLLDCSITIGSPTVTVSSTSGMVPGMAVIGRDNPALIPSGTTIAAVVNATTVTLSQNATASSTTARIIFETRNTFSGGTILNDGSLTLASNSWEYYSSNFPPPSNAFGIGTGPITLNGGTLTLLGHSVSTLHVSGALPNDLIVPSGKTATLRAVMRGTYLNDIAGIRGNLTGSGTLNLIANFSSAAITGDWSAFSGKLNVTRPTTGANDPRFQLGTDAGLPLATVNLDQITLSHTAAPPPEGITIPIGSLTGTNNASTIIAGAETGSAPVTWQIGSLNTSTTFAGNFTPYGNAPIGLSKVGTGTLTLTGTGNVSAGITVENGTLSYGDSSTDTLTGTSEITIDPNATLELNNGAKLSGGSCEIFTGGSLRGHGSLQAPLVSSGILTPTNTLTLAGNANLTGEIEFLTRNDKLAIIGDLELAGTLKLPTGLTAGRHLLITHTGSQSTADITFTNVAPTFLAALDLSTPGEIAVKLMDQSAYQNWQIDNFGSIENPAGHPNADPDTDGMTNLEEYEAATDPNNATSFIPLIWQGSPNNLWDLANTASWLENTTPRIFRNKRHITINDNGSNTPAIALTGTLEPGSITVSNTTKAFTLTGTGTISGPTGLTKSGSNSLTLATSNSFTGPTSINAGTVNIQHNTALGSTTGATTIALNARLELQNNITVTGETLTLSGTGGSSFFNGSLNSKSGTNTWAGPITLAATGTRIGAQTGSTLTISGPITSTPDSTGLTIRPADMTASVILSGSNNYAGETNIIGGVLKLGASNTLPTTTTLRFGGSNISGKLDLNGHHQEIAGFSPISGTSNEITASIPSILTVNTSTASIIPVPITGSAALTKSGLATLTLSIPHTYTGPTTVSSGKLLLDLSVLATPTNLLNPASSLTLAGGTLEIKGKPTAASNQTLSNPTLIPNTSSTITLTPNGSTSTHLTLGNSWTVGENATLLIDLSAGNCAVFSNPTLTGGFLPSIRVKDSIATGPATVVAGQIVRYIPPTLTISSNDPTLEFSSLNSTYPSGILDWTAGGALSSRAVHRLILDTSNTGGTIDLGAPTHILTLSSGEIEFLGSNNLTIAGGQLGANLSAVSLTTAGTNTLTLTSPVSSGTGSLSISGTASIIINSPNTFTGGLLLNGGSITQATTNALGSANGTLTLNSGTLDLNGIATGIGTLTGSGGSITSTSATTLTLGNNNATGGNFAGSINGPIALTKTGTGTQILSGINPHTGITTISAGTLRSNANHAIGNGNLTISGGTLDLQSFSDTVAALTLNSGSVTGSTGLLTATSYSLITGTLSARIGGTSSTLAKSGSSYASSATLSGANTYGGATTLGFNSGSLVLTHNDALGNTLSVDVIGTGTALVLANDITISNKPITLRGTGANNASNLGSFAGGLTTATNATATWTGSVTLGDGNGRLGAGNSGTLHLTGPILGSGPNQSISLSSGSGSTVGTVVLSGSNSFTGNIALVRGNLKLNATNTLPTTAIIDVGSANVSENTTFDLNGSNQTLAGLRRTSTNTTQVSTVTNTSATPATLTLTLNQSASLTFSGLLTGNLTLAKSGSGTLTLSNPNALATTTSLHLDAGALNLFSPHTITALRINGIWQPPGTYTAANSSTRITGSGSLIVTTNGPTSFSSWINSFTSLPATQKKPTADPDHDGNNNLIEWALHLDPTQPDTFQPTLTHAETTLTYTYTRAKNIQATFTIEWSDTLAGDWSSTNVTDEIPVSETTTTRTIQVTLPTGTHGKRFVRLRIISHN